MSSYLDDDGRSGRDDAALTTSIADPSFRDHPVRPAPRRRWLALVVVAACLVLVGGLVIVTQGRTKGAAPLATPGITAEAGTGEQHSYLFPDATNTTRYLDPVDALDAYLADRVATAPHGETVTYVVGEQVMPLDGAPDRQRIAFSLLVTPDDAELCCDGGDGIASIERDGDAWFVSSAEIISMQVATRRYADDGVVSGSFEPSIGGIYTVTVTGIGGPAPEEHSLVVEFDPADSAIAPAFELPGFTAPAVSVRIWQSPGPGAPFPAAMFAEFFLAQGTEDASAISIDLASATTTAP